MDATSEVEPIFSVGRRLGGGVHLFYQKTFALLLIAFFDRNAFIHRGDIQESRSPVLYNI